jgi:hypothetical protein
MTNKDAFDLCWEGAEILLVFRDDLHARTGEPKECGFWGDMEAGMSCR